jgi:pimeloyl-ACP methyl ester carboxylesterase
MNAPSIYKTPTGEREVMALYDGLLGQWPVPYEGLTVETRHGATFVVASGEKSALPLVLLHGAGTNSAVWGADVADYARHYRVYAVDPRGIAPPTGNGWRTCLISWAWKRPPWPVSPRVAGRR